MSNFQSGIDEICAYFRINPGEQDIAQKKFMEIFKLKDGNVPGIFEEILNTREIPAIQKLVMVYALGMSISENEHREDMERAIGESIQKGIEIGSQLPPGSKGNIEIIRDKRGIGVLIKQDKDKPGEQSTETPAIAENKQNSDRMFG